MIDFFGAVHTTEKVSSEMELGDKPSAGLRGWSLIQNRGLRRNGACVLLCWVPGLAKIRVGSRSPIGARASRPPNMWM